MVLFFDVYFVGFVFFLSILLSADSVMGRLNFLISFWCVMLGFFSISVFIWVICVLFRVGFLPQLVYFVSRLPVLWYSAQIFVTVLLLTKSQYAMSVSFSLFCLCLIIFFLSSFVMAFGMLIW